MSIVLATKFSPHVDEKFAAESKLSLLTNKDYDWDGAQTVKVYKISTSGMNDYGRNGAASGNWSRYGAVADLDATVETLTLAKDRSFTFAIDRLDSDETVATLAAASALERQLREVVIPEVDTYVYNKMATNAGTTATAAALDADGIYAAILSGSEALDNALVPETDRYIIVTPAVYTMMKKSGDIIMATDIAEDMRIKGVIGMIDGLGVIRVPAARLPEGFGFMLCHPSATVAPVKLEDYTIHDNPPGISGALVEGRICYDAFVLENKNKAIYYQPVTAG